MIQTSITSSKKRCRRSLAFGKTHWLRSCFITKPRLAQFVSSQSGHLIEVQLQNSRNGSFHGNCCLTYFLLSQFPYDSAITKKATQRACIPLSQRLTPCRAMSKKNEFLDLFQSVMGSSLGHAPPLHEMSRMSAQ